MLLNNGTFSLIKKKERIIVCLVGVINRSIKDTWFSIENNIINELKKKYIVDLALFNNNVGNCLVDGVKLNNRNLRQIPYNYLFEFLQTNIDKKISKIKDFNKEFPPYWKTRFKLNGIRQMYMESIVAEFLKKSTYKIALVSNPDHLYINKFDCEQEIMSDHVTTCAHLDMNGFTNGFYYGHTNNIIKILKRINDYDKLIQINTNKINYEQILKRSFQMNKIKRFTTDLFFIKIRANREIQIFGMDYIKESNTTKKIYLEYLNKNKDKHPIYKYLLSIYK